MSIDEVKILGVNMSNLSQEDLVNILIEEISRYDPCYIVTPNPEIVFIASTDKNFRNILNAAKYRIPDGIGIIMASKILGKPIKERVSGVDVFELIGNLGKIRIYLLGSREEIVSHTARTLKEKYDNIEDIGFHNGYFNSDQNEDILLKIKEFNPHILFVGMGCPKQEEWIYNNYKKTSANVVIAIGGSFDVVSGFKKRAPLIIRKIGLEWFYRFLQEPSKRWKRLFRLPSFLIMVIFERFFKKTAVN